MPESENVIMEAVDVSYEPHEVNLNRAKSDKFKADPSKDEKPHNLQRIKSQNQDKEPNFQRGATDPDFRETTYVKAPKNAPAGINMKDFVMTDAGAQEEKKTGTKRDLEIINEVMEQHPVMVSVMQRRLD